MSESIENPSFILRVGDVEIEATPDNASLYTFIGHTAVLGALFENSSANHIFLFDKLADPDEPQGGRYVFLSEESTDTILPYMVTTGYQCHVNLPQVSSGDMEAYQTFARRVAEHEAEETPDFIPEDWI